MDLGIGPVKVRLDLQFRFNLFKSIVATHKNTHEWFQIQNKTTDGGVRFRFTTEIICQVSLH